jgi:hypothetical protein
MSEDLKKVLDYVEQEEKINLDLAIKASKAKNAAGSQVYSASAGAYRKVRFIIKSIINGDNNGNIS